MSRDSDKLERPRAAGVTVFVEGVGSLPESGVVAVSVEAVSPAGRRDAVLAWRAASSGRRLVVFGGSLDDRLAAVRDGADDAVAELAELEERVAVQAAILERCADTDPHAREDDAGRDAADHDQADRDEAGVARWSLGHEASNFTGDWRGLLGEHPPDEVCSGSSELAQQWWAQRQHPHDMLPLHRAWERACQGETAGLDNTFRLRHRDGSWVWVRVVSEDFRAVDGVFVAARGSVRAVDEATAAREQARVTSELLTHLSSAIPGALFRVEAHDSSLPRPPELVFVNDGMARLLGLESSPQSPWLPVMRRFLHPEDFERVLAQLVTAYRERQDWQDVFRVVAADGAVRTVRAEATYEARDERAPVDAWNGVLVDIDHEVRARDELNATIDRLAAIERLGRVGGIELGVDGQTTWTAEARRLTGLEGDEDPGLDALLQSVDAGDRARLEEQVRALREQGESLRVQVTLARESDRRAGEEPRSVRIFGDRTGQEDGRCLLVVQDVTGRRRAERALLESRARLREIVDTIPGGVYRRVLTITGEFLIDFVSQGIVTITGRPPEFFVGDVSVLREIIHEDDQDAYLALMAESARRGGPLFAEYRIVRPDGEVVWVRNQARPTPAADTESMAWTGAIFDITNERSALQELRQSERRLRELFENARDGLVICDAELEIVAVNSRACELLDRPERELVGRFAREIGGPDRDEALRRSREALASGRESGEIRVPTGAGERVIEYRTSRVGPDRLLTSLVDITERKRRELELTRNKALLARTEALNRTGGWEFDTATEELRWTDQTFRLYELPVGRVPPVADCISYYAREDQGTIREAFQRLVETGRAFDLRLGFVTAHGRRVRIRTTGEAEWLDGRISRVFGTFQDITDLVVTEQQLRRQNQLRDSLIEYASEGICVISTDAATGRTEFLIWNERMTEITGYTREDMELHGWSDTLYSSPDDLAEFRVRTQRLARGDELRHEEVHVTHKSGEPRILEMSTARISPGSDSEAEEYYVTLVSDLTERRELERRLIESSTHEQQRIGHDLHDTISQQLVGLSLFTRAFVSGLGGERPEIAEKGRHLLESLKSITASVRSISSMLSPLQDGSFETALEGLARSITVGFGVTCRASCGEDSESLDATVAAELYRIAQEAATNAAKHSRGMLIRIEYGVTLAGPYLFVFDDGTGFDRSRTSSVRGMGLRIMEYRARSIGWTIEWRSQRPGTLVVCRPRRKLSPGGGPRVEA